MLLELLLPSVLNYLINYIRNPDKSNSVLFNRLSKSMDQFLLYQLLRTIADHYDVPLYEESVNNGKRN